MPPSVAPVERVATGLREGGDGLPAGHPNGPSLRPRELSPPTLSPSTKEQGARSCDANQRARPPRRSDGRQRSGHSSHRGPWAAMGERGHARRPDDAADEPGNLGLDSLTGGGRSGCHFSPESQAIRPLPRVGQGRMIVRASRWRSPRALRRSRSRILRFATGHGRAGYRRGGGTDAQSFLGFGVCDVGPDDARRPAGDDSPRAASFLRHPASEPDARSDSTEVVG